MKISVIVPTYNEADVIEQLLAHLDAIKKQNMLHEVIVADGGSTDTTCAIVNQYDVILCTSSKQGRAAQMNYGAQYATGDVLYFLHADAIPDDTTYQKIIDVITAGYVAGTSVIVFTSTHWTFWLSTQMSKLKAVCARFGDQGLFIKTTVFREIGMFDASLLLFEDQEIFKRISKVGKTTVLDTTIQTSARRFEKHGIYKVHAIYYLLNALYQIGISQKKLYSLYKQLL